MKRLFPSLSCLCLFLGISVLGLTGRAGAQTWSVSVSDTFTRADTSTGGAGTTTGLGNGWIDKVGSVFSISSNQAKGASNSRYAAALRPTSENALNQRVDVTSIGGHMGAVVRSQLGSFAPSYYAQIFGGVGDVFADGTLITQVTLSSYSATDSYTLSLRVVGSSPTTVTAIWTDNTTSTTFSAPVVTNSLASLQTAGQDGFFPDTSPSYATAATTYISAITTPTTFAAVGNANLFLSPYNWDTQISAGQAWTDNQGAYLKTTANLTATADLMLTLDTTNFATLVASADPPYIAYSVDSQLETVAHLTPAALTGTSPAQYLKIGTALSAGAHSVYVTLLSHSQIGVNQTNQATVITGLGATAGTLTLSAPTLRPNRAIFYGDSITEGEGTESSNGSPTYALSGNSEHSYAAYVAAAMDCEYGIVAFGGQAWQGQGAGYGGNSGFIYTWTHYFDTADSRLSGGLFSPLPDYLFVNMGTNTGTGFTASLVSTWMTSARAAAGTSCKIVMLVPFNRATLSTFISAFQTYQGGSGNVSSVAVSDMTAYKGTADPNCLLIDLGPTASAVANYPLGAYDNVHPTAQAHAQYAARIARCLQAATASTGGANTLSLTIAHPDGTHTLLTWTADPAATQYKILRSMNGTSPYAVIGTVSPPTTTFTTTTVPGSHYTVSATH